MRLAMENSSKIRQKQSAKKMANVKGLKYLKFSLKKVNLATLSLLFSLFNVFADRQ